MSSQCNSWCVRQGCYWGIKWLDVQQSRQSLVVLHVHTVNIHYHSCWLKAGHKGQATTSAQHRCRLLPHHVDWSLSCRTEQLCLKIPQSELAVNRFCCQHNQAPQYLTDYCLPLSWMAASLFCHSTSTDHIMSKSQHIQLPGPEPMSQNTFHNENNTAYLAGSVLPIRTCAAELASCSGSLSSISPANY